MAMSFLFRQYNNIVREMQAKTGKSQRFGNGVRILPILRFHESNTNPRAAKSSFFAPPFFFGAADADYIPGNVALTPSLTRAYA